MQKNFFSNFEIQGQELKFTIKIFQEENEMVLECGSSILKEDKYGYILYFSQHCKYYTVF